MRGAALIALVATLLPVGCAYEWRHQIQSDSRDQIWQADASQVKVRAAQSRVFDTSDERRMLVAVVSAFQDLDFQVEVLDEVLGIVSGNKFVDLERPSTGFDPSYFLYDDQGLITFTRAYRTWGPFSHRSDLVRLTVTVRARNESQLIVRASAQFYLRPIEEAEPYQGFFALLEQSFFAEGQLAEGSVRSPEAPDSRDAGRADRSPH